MGKILERAAIASASIALVLFATWPKLTEIKAVHRVFAPSLEEKISQVAKDNLSYVVHIQVN